MEYIVAYSSSEANIRLKCADIDFCHNEMNDMYIWALSRYPDKTYGDIVAYNNQFWCVVDAENAADALKVYFEKEVVNKKEQEAHELTKTEWEQWKKDKNREPICMVWYGDTTHIWVLKPENVNEPLYLMGKIKLFDKKPRKDQVKWND